MIALNEIISLLSELIACRSYTKKNVNNAMERCAERLKSWGLTPQIHTNRGYKILTTTVGSGNKTIVLNGHLDVVPGEEEQFVPKIEGKKFFGRGSYDMLGAVSAMMSAMKSLSEKKLDCRVVLMLVPTEETDGSIGTQYLIKKGISGDFAICGEPTNLNISIMSKGVLQLRITSFGVSAHGGTPWLGENAILKAQDVFKNIKSLPFTNAKNDYFDGPSINLGKLYGGDVINRVPDQASMEIDIRYLPGQDVGEIIEQIRSIDSSLKIEILQMADAVQTDKHNPYIRRLKKVMRDRGIKSSFIAQHGTADTRFFHEAGIPSVEFGPIGANHHGPDEYVDIMSLMTYRDILMDFIEKSGQGGEENIGLAIR
jgi:succinyl-diaminopimelate desuccinylase